MSEEDKKDLAFYVGISAFAVMLFASFVFPLIWDVTDYNQYEQYLHWYIFAEHAVALALAKTSRMFINVEWKKIILDIFIAGLYGDLIDRLLGDTEFHGRDLYIIGLVLTAISFKYLRQLWIKRRERY